MHVLTQLLNLLLPFFGVIALGYVCGKRMNIPESGLAWMNFFIIYVALPPLFFRLMVDKPIDELINWRFVLTTMLGTYVIFSIAMAYATLRHGTSPAEAVMQGVAGSYANVGYMGPPLVIGALGTAASAPVALVFVGDVILLFCLVPLLMAFATDEQRKLSAVIGGIIWRILSHPFNVAAALGIGFSYLQITIPAWSMKMVTWLSDASAPCALFVLGVTVAIRQAPGIGKEVPGLVMLKLVFHPLLVWLLLSVVGDFDATWSYAAVLMAALPPALTSFVFATQYKIGLDRAASCILVGTIASMLTLTGLLWLMKTGHLPADLFPGSGG
jgi:malonate transporter and related proteins